MDLSWLDAILRRSGVPSDQARTIIADADAVLRVQRASTPARLRGTIDVPAGAHAHPPEALTLSSDTSPKLTPSAFGDLAAPVIETPVYQGHPRYQPVEVIGMGGMSEVWRAWDRVMERHIAIKIIRADRRGDDKAIKRFTREAVITARLQHPGITPVYDAGMVVDGREFFVMKEIQGITLEEGIKALHEPEGVDAETFSLWRLVEILWKVCEAVAYAHEQGILHRDLKPQNVMIGPFGEVLVVDWGIAKALERPDSGPAPRRKIDPASMVSGEGVTEAGSLIGTPSYMAPEMVIDEHYRSSPPADVYALGAILYEILAGHPPHTGATNMAIVLSIAKGPPPPLPSETPPELAAICSQAMSPQPAARFPTSQDMAQAIRAWLEQARRREQAIELLERAEVFNPANDQRSLRGRAAALRAQAQAMLSKVRPWHAIETKLPAWTLEDEADRYEASAELNEARYLQGLESALSLVPDLKEAHDRLAAYHRRKHEEAEGRGDDVAAARHELHLRAHDRGQHRAYLEGNGAFTLVTQPTGAEVSLYSYELHQRRLVPVFQRRLGRTPIHDHALNRGSYLIRIEAPGRRTVDYPVQIRRGERWDGVRPGEEQPHPITLPPKGALGEDDILVPAGWFRVGGDDTAPSSFPAARVWVDAFVIERYPVSNRRYLAFLNDLLDRGDEARALAHVPRGQAAHPGEPGAPAYERDEDGRFTLGVDADGDRWLLDWPVMLVRWTDAVAFAAWQAQRDGLPWRLPVELEWEKAARGVDGRTLPWGSYADATWCCMLHSHPERPMLATIDAFSGDESPYGVRGMAGNVRDWCLDEYQLDYVLPTLSPSPSVEAPEGPDDAFRITRGGYFASPETAIHLAARAWVPASNRGTITGFRLVRPL